MSKKYYQIILTKADLVQWIKKIQFKKFFAFDVETDNIDVLSAHLIGLSFAIKKNEGFYLPLKHNYLNVPKQLLLDEVLTTIKPILINGNIQKISKNLKFNYAIMANYNIELKNMLFDTKIESYILNSIDKFKYDRANATVQQCSNCKSVISQEVNYKKNNQLGSNQITLEKSLTYATENLNTTLLLHQTFWPKLEAEPKLKNVFQEIEMPLIPILARMEKVGVLVDANKLIKQSQDITNKLAEIEKVAYSFAKQKFNLASTKQLQNILFKKLQLPVIKKTPSGTASTNEEVLKELSYIHDLPKIVLQHRCLSKLKSNYTTKLPMMIHPKTKRIHTSYYQAVTVTGRLSSRNPNLQNIPIRTEEGRKIRQAFIARKGYKIVAADYSQIELRIMAHFSQDKGLLNAFAEGQDIHKATAAEIFGILLTDVTNEQRRIAKVINFGLIYGMSVFGLSRQLKITHSKAQYYMNNYFKKYPGVLNYMKGICHQAVKQGYVETLTGRRLYLPDINSYNTTLRKASEREAINAPLQGTAADIIKKAMIILDKWIESVKPNLYMLMQVHDELVFEVKASKADQLQKKIRQLMEQSMELTVPLKVDIGIGNNWDEAH